MFRITRDDKALEGVPQVSRCGDESGSFSGIHRTHRAVKSGGGAVEVSERRQNHHGQCLGRNRQRAPTKSTKSPSAASRPSTAFSLFIFLGPCALGSNRIPSTPLLLFFSPGPTSLAPVFCFCSSFRALRRPCQFGLHVLRTDHGPAPSSENSSTPLPFSPCAATASCHHLPAFCFLFLRAHVGWILRSLGRLAARDWPDDCRCSWRPHPRLQDLCW